MIDKGKDKVKDKDKNKDKDKEGWLAGLSGAEEEDLIVPSHLTFVLPDLPLNLRVDPPDLLIHIRCTGCL